MFIMRCFVAVDLAKELKDKVVELQRRIPGDVKLVKPENLHFTLKFLGEIDGETHKRVSEIIKDIASSFRPFNIFVKGVGVFPSLNYIRVVWIGGEVLQVLQNATENALAQMFKKEKSVPHLTIARVRSPKGLDAIKEFVNANESIDIGAMRVDRIKLKNSTLMPKGPVYEDSEVYYLS